MRSIVEINAEKDELRAKAQGILENGKKEERKLNEGEQGEFDSITARMAELDAEIEAAEEEARNIQNNINNNQNQEMESMKFSLFETVRAMSNGQELSDASKAYVRDNKISLPTEKRAAVTVTASSGATVPVEVEDMFAALRDENVLVAAGAKWLTGLKGDVKVPVLGGATAAWGGETASADVDGAEAVTGVTLQPKRLTCVVPISKQFLMQDAASAEAMIQADLATAIYEKLQDTILGTAAASASAPAGIGNGLTPTTVSTFASIAAVEAGLEAAKFNHLAYICSPTAKASLRGVTYNKNTRLIYENDNVDGTPAYCVSSVAADSYYVGDFSNLIIGQFGDIEITVDPYSLAGMGEVKLIVNAFFDAKMARSGAVALAKF